MYDLTLKLLLDSYILHYITVVLILIFGIERRILNEMVSRRMSILKVTSYLYKVDYFPSQLLTKYMSIFINNFTSEPKLLRIFYTMNFPINFSTTQKLTANSTDDLLVLLTR